MSRQHSNNNYCDCHLSFSLELNVIYVSILNIYCVITDNGPKIRHTFLSQVLKWVSIGPDKS